MQITRRGGALLALAACSLIGGIVAPAAAADGHSPQGGRSEQGQERAAAHQAEPAPASSGGQASEDNTSSGSSGSTVTEENDGDGAGNAENTPGDTDNEHPSGRDRSLESGKSGNQGRAQSDPDGASNDGVDQPGGSGGDDTFDQDGNNGCGNDDDFEDDNNGRCGKPRQESARGAAGTRSKAEPKAQPQRSSRGTTNAEATGRPSSSKRPSGENVDGKGTAAIVVDARCRLVTATSSKDISNVVVTFVDGTTEKFDGLTGTSWSEEFDKDVAGATAKSGTTRVTDMTGPCGDAGTGGHALGAAASATGSPRDVADQPVEGAVLSAAGAAAPDGTVSARSAGVVGAVFSTALGGALAATGGNPTVLVMIGLGLLVAGVVLVLTDRGFGLQTD